MASSRKQASIGVCVVAQHPLVAQYLLQLLGEDPHFYATLLNSAGPQAAQDSAVLLVDCAGLPLPVCECLPRLRPRAPSASVVVLDVEIMDADRMVQWGIRGFVPYSDVVDALIPAVRAVANGKTWARKEVLQEYLQKNLIAHNGGLGRGAGLTERENVIMDLVKRRMSNNEIAGVLGVRESTVKFHISNLFSKLHVKSRRDLIDREEAVRLWDMLVHSSLRREST